MLQLYNTYAYTPFHIWNVDENGCNASKSGLKKVLARKGTRNVHTQIFNKRKRLRVLTSIKFTASQSILHSFIFKGKMRLKDYIQHFEGGSTMAMQVKGYMTSYLFFIWMDHFIQQLKELEDLSPFNRQLIEQKNHVTLQVIQKVNAHGVDMISLPSHTFHALQPLDVACFKPFKIVFRACRIIGQLRPIEAW